MRLMTPNDPRALIREQEQRREEQLAGIEAVFTTLYAAMHQVDGTIDPGEHQEHHWSSQRMANAGSYLEVARMFIEKHIEEM